MTVDPDSTPAMPLVWPFPRPGPRVRLAYRELNIALNGTAQQKQALGDLSELPRPWDPETCLNPELRLQVWNWLEAVVTWLNHEYAWDVAPMIPSCWPHHPHLVREVAVLADQRRRAGLGVTSDPLEEWHRYGLPTFLDRMRLRVKEHCAEGHKCWPGRGRFVRHISQEAREARENSYAADLDTVERHTPPQRHRRLVIVDDYNGEIVDRLDP